MDDWTAKIQELARKLKRPVETLIAMGASNDPFYFPPHRIRNAEWFAALYQEHGFGLGVHLRRIHYRLVSQQEPVQMPTGEDYVNTSACFVALCNAASGARYLGLVDINDFIDQRNPSADLRLPGAVEEPDIFASSGTLEIDIPDDFRKPRLFLDAECPTPYHVEIWAEKSTVNDVLARIMQRYGAAGAVCGSFA
jgi:hypothetical protein